MARTSDGWAYKKLGSVDLGDARRDDVVWWIDWYRTRWEIEIYFHVLKNRCCVKALQLGAVDRIERALALFMIVAWRIAYLMRMGRMCPDLDAAFFFDPDEIHIEGPLAFVVLTS